MVIVKEFKSQTKAQAFVKQLISKGLEPGVDFYSKTKPNGVYCVYVHADEGHFGIFGA